jgi:hypothetical protein
MINPNKNNLSCNEVTASAFDNTAFRNVLRKAIDTPKEQVERGLAEQKTERIKKRKTTTKAK